MRNRTFSAALVGVGLWLAAPAGVQALTILDEFEEPVGGQVVTLTNPVPGAIATNTALGLSNVAGGTRELTLEAQSVFAGGSQAQAEINLATSPGNFQLTNSIRIDSIVSIGWTADAAGFDLSSETSFALQGVENDLATDYTIRVTSPAGSASLTLSQSAGFSGDLDFAFASFAGPIDLDDISSIVLEIDGVRGADVIIDRLVAVPEPATAAALGLGLCGLAWMGRRRQRA